MNLHLEEIKKRLCNSCGGIDKEITRDNIEFIIDYYQEEIDNNKDKLIEDSEVEVQYESPYTDNAIFTSKKSSSIIREADWSRDQISAIDNYLS